MRRAILSNVVCRFAPNFFKLSHKWHDFRDRLLAARQTPNLEDLWLEPSNSRHKVPSVWNDTSEPQQRKVEISDNFAESGDFHVTFWFLLHAVNLRHWTDGFTSPPKEGALRVFSPEISDGFGRVWACELGYQRPARSSLDHRSRLQLRSKKFIILRRTQPDIMVNVKYLLFLSDFNENFSWHIFHKVLKYQI